MAATDALGESDEVAPVEPTDSAVLKRSPSADAMEVGEPLLLASTSVHASGESDEAAPVEPFDSAVVERSPSADAMEVLTADPEEKLSQKPFCESNVHATGALDATVAKASTIARWSESVVNHRTWERFDAELGTVPVIQAIAEALNVTPLTVAMLASFAFLAFLLYGFGGQLVCMLLGVAYPAFESFKVVEAFANMSDQTDLYTKAASLQFWLTYWIVVAVLATGEYFFYFALQWFPFYFPIKLLFLFWLFNPVTRGANHVYNWFVSPLLRRNRDKIDLALKESGRTITESGRKLHKQLSGAALNAVGSSVGTALVQGSNSAKRLLAAGQGVKQLFGESVVNQRTGASTLTQRLSKTPESPESFD